MTSLELEIDELVVSVSTENNDYSGEKTVQRNAAEVGSLEEELANRFAVCHNGLNTEQDDHAADGNPNAQSGKAVTEVHGRRPEHMSYNVERIGKALGTEEYPGEGYKRKCEEHGQRSCEPRGFVEVSDLQEFILDGLDKACKNNVNTVEEAPSGVGVTRTVPYATNGKCDHLVKNPARLGNAVSAERYVDVILEPGGK